MKKPLPMTPGLLISMSVRNDHSFGMDDVFSLYRNPEPIQVKQIKLINTSFDEYQTYLTGVPIQSQRMEELTGEGFYSTEREAYYLNMATPEAYQHAVHLCECFAPEDNSTTQN